MFFVADVFHKRAIHEIRALWRKGSSVPVMRRFYRFGSMNLLISLGVSISYFASVALLALDAVREQGGTSTGTHETGGVDPEPEPVMHTTTYFDSTVFLTMFLLAGE
jgi:cation transport ATPase